MCYMTQEIYTTGKLVTKFLKIKKDLVIIQKPIGRNYLFDEVVINQDNIKNLIKFIENNF